MEYFTGFGSSIGAFIIVLSIIVVIHELGHYWAGRIFGMSIDAFSLGFGPELYSRVDKNGVKWRLAALPLGGYVKFTGDEDAASVTHSQDIDKPADEKWFAFSPLWQRAIVIAAGPLANFILAIGIFAGSLALSGKTILLPYVGAVVEGSAAEAAGVQEGDIILAIDGKAIESFVELQRIVHVSAGESLDFTIERNSQEITLPITPKVHEEIDPFGAPIRMGLIGIQSQQDEKAIKTLNMGIVESLIGGVQETGYLIKRSASFIAELITGEQSVKQLGGPVKIAEVSGMAASAGISSLVTFIALISVSIGFLNLLPLPPLDGGHLMFYAIEAITRRPVSDRVKEYMFRFGFALVLTMMVFVTWQDLSSLYSRMVG